MQLYVHATFTKMGNLVCSYCLSKFLEDDQPSPPTSSFFDGISADIRIKHKSMKLKKEMEKRKKERNIRKYEILKN
jgi:hypothetical protein